MGIKKRKKPPQINCHHCWQGSSAWKSWWFHWSILCSKMLQSLNIDPGKSFQLACMSDAATTIRVVCSTCGDSMDHLHGSIPTRHMCHSNSPSPSETHFGDQWNGMECLCCRTCISGSSQWWQFIFICTPKDLHLFAIELLSDEDDLHVQPKKD